MKNYVHLAASYLPKYISENAKSLYQVQLLAQNLPIPPISYFELHLGSQDNLIDFQVGFSHTNAALWAIKLARLSNGERYRDFLEDWADSQSVLHKNISHIFLEFDTSQISPRATIPCLFLGLKQKTTVNEIISTIKLAHLKLYLSIDSSAIDNIAAFLWQLPHSTQVASIGFMLSRPHQPIRIVLKESSLETILDIQQNLFGVELSSQFPSVTSDVFKFLDSTYLSFDINQSVYPRVGLECFLFKQPPKEIRWKLLFEHLCLMNYLTEKEANALLSWPGFSQKENDPDLWPYNISIGDSFLSEAALSIFWRMLSHVKIVHDISQNSVLAKAYLAFGHSWIDSHDANEELS